MKDVLKPIIDAAKNDDMHRVIELAEKQLDKFCDNNCVWTDHHPDCIRAEPKREQGEAQLEVPKIGCVNHDCGYCQTKREWVGMTYEDQKAIADIAGAEDWHDYQVMDATEAKLKEKNNEWLA